MVGLLHGAFLNLLDVNNSLNVECCFGKIKHVEFKGNNTRLRIINRPSIKPNLLKRSLIWAIATFTVLITAFSIQTAIAEEKMSVEIISIEPIRAYQWTISWDACSLVEKLGQDFKITTDLEWESFHIDFILYQDQCVSDIMGHPFISIIDAKDPDSISITLDEPIKPTNEQKIIITDILSAKIQGKYVAFFDVCAGDKRLIAPEIIVYSDTDETQATLGSVIGLNSCFSHSAEIYAENIESIQVQFGTVSDLDKVSDDISLDEVVAMEGQIEEQREEISQIKAEISELKETLKEKEQTIVKKDAVLMEQIKVIKDLASMVTNTIFESLSKVFQF